MLLGNGPSLNDIPVSFLESYPSIGCNTICEKYDFEPWYYVAVDSRVMNEYGGTVLQRFAEIPKFIPTPNLDAWQGENFVRWYHRPGPLVLKADDFFNGAGITYISAMDVMLQLAFLMGFTTMLIVGMDHGYRRAHFWGADEGGSNLGSGEWWSIVDDAHRELFAGLCREGVAVLNISTHSNCRVFPRGDWKDWRV